MRFVALAASLLVLTALSAPLSHAATVTVGELTQDVSSPSGYYLDGTNNQPYYWDENAKTLAPVKAASGVGYFFADAYGPGQSTSILTMHTERCPASASYCGAWVAAVVLPQVVTFVDRDTPNCQPGLEVDFTYTIGVIPQLLQMNSVSHSPACGGLGEVFVLDNGALRAYDSMAY